MQCIGQEIDQLQEMPPGVSRQGGTQGTDGWLIGHATGRMRET